MLEENEKNEKTEEEIVSAPPLTEEVPAAADPMDASSDASADENPGKGDPETEELRAELEKVRGQVAKLEHERFLLGRGVPEEDLDYYAFKIGQLDGAEENFAEAAKDYLKAHPVRRTTVSSGAELGAGGSRKPATSSELMNQLLRNH